VASITTCRGCEHARRPIHTVRAAARRLNVLSSGVLSVTRNRASSERGKPSNARNGP